MRIASIAGIVVLAMLSAAHAQQSSQPTGEAIGHPPPLPGPPPLSEPESKTQTAPAASTPRAGEPAPKGYTGAYQPAGTPPTPYSKDPSGAGSNTIGQEDVSERKVKAVPCGVAAKKPMDRPPASEFPIRLQIGEVAHANIVVSQIAAGACFRPAQKRDFSFQR